jgi:subfamily B ATP-binding cassette protein MsbA
MSTFFKRLSRITPYFHGGRMGFVAAIGAAVVVAATEPMIPALLQPLLDEGFTGDGIPLWIIPLAVIGLFILRGGGSFVAQYALSWSTTLGVLALREAMFEHLMKAAPDLYSRQSTSSLTNTVVYEVQQGATLLVGSALTLLRDSLTLVFLLGYLLWLNWKLTMCVAILAPAVALVIRVVSRRLHKLTVAGQAANDELAYVVEENVLAWRIVRLHGASDTQRARFSVHSHELRRLMMKSVAAAASMSPVTQLLAACALSAVIVVALWQSNTGGVTVGSFVAFITAMLMLLSPIKHLSDVAAPLTRGLAALERGVAVIENNPRESGGSYDPGPVGVGATAGGADAPPDATAHRDVPTTPRPVRGEIELRDVSLRYREDQAPALDHVDLTVQAGEIVALVGPSGAGKSTLVHLLPRFVEPTSGSVTLDGVPLPDWNTAALRRQFALVSQDVVLFNDTVAANVCLGGPLDRERVAGALRGANLMDYVSGLASGMDTVIGHNGRELSGGQRQRMAIARAIYKDAPILILDEATSALDSESERAVQDALDRLMRGRTTIVIAHRLSTIEHAHRVVAMDAGRIAEQGTHAALLEAGGLYARLHSMQFRS